MDIEFFTNVIWYASGGLLCTVTSFFAIGWRSYRLRYNTCRRVEYAILAGIGSFGLNWVVHRFFPEYFIASDSVPVGILTGFLGISRTLQIVAKKLGIETDVYVRRQKGDSTDV